MMVFPEASAIQTWLQGFLERIEKLAGQSDYAGRISAKIGFLGAAPQQKDFEAFAAQVPDADRLEFLNMSNRITIQASIQAFLRAHPNALIYNLPPDLQGLLGRQDKRRNVELDQTLTSEQGFPIFAAVNFITARERTAISAELLRDIPKAFMERVIFYNGSNLEVPVSAMDFAFAAIVEQLFAASA
jgi:hypothetical protein